MVAHIYLHPDNFRYNNVDSEAYLASKLKSLVNDMEEVVCLYSDENKFFTVPDLFEIDIFYKEQIYSFANKHLIGDEQGVLYSMLANVSESTATMTLEELETKCIYRAGEQNPTSMMVLNAPEENQEDEEKHKDVSKPYIAFDHYEIIYGKNNWRTFRRQILGNHPGCAEGFISECNKYFPALQIHRNCISTLCDDNYNYLVTSPRRIVYYLSVLNDCFKGIYEKYINNGKETSSPNAILADFSGSYHLDISGSLDADPSTRALRTFEFTSMRTNTQVRLYCDPHLKIEQPDAEYCGTYRKSDFHPRIYFHYDYVIETTMMHIYVGSIGKHL